jgi:hypothetical protein
MFFPSYNDDPFHSVTSLSSLAENRYGWRGLTATARTCEMCPVNVTLRVPDATSQICPRGAGGGGYSYSFIIKQTRSVRHVIQTRVGNQSKH